MIFILQLFNELQEDQGGVVGRTSEGFLAIKVVSFNLSFCCC